MTSTASIPNCQIYMPCGSWSYRLGRDTYMHADVWTLWSTHTQFIVGNLLGQSLVATWQNGATSMLDNRILACYSALEGWASHHRASHRHKLGYLRIQSNCPDRKKHHARRTFYVTFSQSFPPGLARTRSMSSHKAPPAHYLWGYTIDKSMVDPQWSPVHGSQFRVEKIDIFQLEVTSQHLHNNDRQRNYYEDHE